MTPTEPMGNRVHCPHAKRTGPQVSSTPRSCGLPTCLIPASVFAPEPHFDLRSSGGTAGIPGAGDAAQAFALDVLGWGGELTGGEPAAEEGAPLACPLVRLPWQPSVLE